MEWCFLSVCLFSLPSPYGVSENSPPPGGCATVLTASPQRVVWTRNPLPVCFNHQAVSYPTSSLQRHDVTFPIRKMRAQVIFASAWRVNGWRVTSVCQLPCQAQGAQDERGLSCPLGTRPHCKEEMMGEDSGRYKGNTGSLGRDTYRELWRMNPPHTLYRHFSLPPKSITEHSLSAYVQQAYYLMPI